MRCLGRCGFPILIHIVTLTENRRSVVHPSSHLRLCIYAQKCTGKDILAGTLEIPFDSFHPSESSQSGLFFLHIFFSNWFNISLAESIEIPFVLGDRDATPQPTVFLKMSVLTATNTTAQGANAVPDKTLTATSAASNSTSSPQDGLHVDSGTAAPLPEEGQTDILPAEKAIYDTDQAVNSMQPVPGIAITAANLTITPPNAIDNVVSVYNTWQNAVGTLKVVMVVVDKIAEVTANYLPMTGLNILCQIHPYAKMAWSVLSLIPKVCPLSRF